MPEPSLFPPRSPSPASVPEETRGDGIPVCSARSDGTPGGGRSDGTPGGGKREWRTPSSTGSGRGTDPAATRTNVRVLSQPVRTGPLPEPRHTPWPSLGECAGPRIA
ncbi:hypothetical protein GCM10010282_05000 [Streptomyces roseolus]|nr:hypothetical protein GCM10010282_05000 [Streptomyces roseolus]